MKKILLAVSALSAALFSTAANADISVSGSANAVYVDADGNSQGHVGGTISFSMSTTTDGGVTISTGGQITNDPDTPGGAGTASGMTALTFAFANGSITVADEVAVPAGTGLGSSGTFTNALLKALYANIKQNLNQQELAELACHIEIDCLNLFCKI